MQKLLVFLFVLVELHTVAQDDTHLKTDPIVKEGWLLYRSEMASWLGTDMFLGKYTIQDNIGGYFSYTDGDSAKCIFFSRAEEPFVIGTISFDSTYDSGKATLDFTERYFTMKEADLFKMRRMAFNQINTDTFFKGYENTNLNLIPLIEGEERKVYVLTGPKDAGVVIFGNDYLLTYDGDNKLVSQKRLHNNLIPVFTKNEEGGAEALVTMHSHLPETGEFITATDICTLLLYGRYTKWKTHHVVSKQYLNIWDIESKNLTVLSMEVMKKIYKDQEKRNKKRNKKRKNKAINDF